jgi:hypothetical protein
MHGPALAPATGNRQRLTTLTRLPNNSIKHLKIDASETSRYKIGDRHFDWFVSREGG